MVFLYILVLIIVLLIAYMCVEAGWVQVERHDFSGGSKQGLKVLQLSDIHIELMRVPASKVRKIVKAEKPDIILLTGDYINEPVHASDFLDYLQTVIRGYRTFVCLGNHDYRAYKNNKAGLSAFVREIESLGAEVLQDQCVQVEKDRTIYNIIGINDLRWGHPDLQKSLEGCRMGSPKIAFTHNPDIVLDMPAKMVDYLFCGHFHGGQIWMPFNLEFSLIRKDQLCRMGFRRGLHKINDIKVLLNRGLGNVALPFRFLSRPEITICYIP